MVLWELSSGRVILRDCGLLNPNYLRIPNKSVLCWSLREISQLTFQQNRSWFLSLEYPVVPASNQQNCECQWHIFCWIWGIFQDRVSQPLLFEAASVAWALSEAVYLKDENFPCADNLLSLLAKINLVYANKGQFPHGFHRNFPQAEWNETKKG